MHSATSERAPKAALALTAFFGPFILFLLVTLSAPHISSISFTDLTSSDSATELSTGVLGFCYTVGAGTALQAGRSMTGVQQVGNNPPSEQAIWWGCRQLGVGWDAQIMPDYAQGSFSPVAPAALTRALVLNILVVAAAGLGLLMLLVLHCSPGRTTPLANFALFGMIALLAWIAFAVDIAFSVKTRDNLQGIWAAWRVSLGNANWLALGGAIAATLAFASASIDYKRFTSSRRNRESKLGLEKAPTTQSSTSV